jgi:hypothetical protein
VVDHGGRNLLDLQFEETWNSYAFLGTI